MRVRIVSLRFSKEERSEEFGFEVGLRCSCVRWEMIVMLGGILSVFWVIDFGDYGVESFRLKLVVRISRVLN